MELRDLARYHVAVNAEGDRSIVRRDSKLANEKKGKDAMAHLVRQMAEEEEKEASTKQIEP